MNKIKNFLFALIFLFFTISCEIGLGASVDAEPPELKIQTPQPDAVVRGAYKIGGTWSDDGTIESVIVTLKRTDGKGKPVSFPANVTKSNDENQNKNAGEWDCVINPTDANAKILDGTYIAQADITDAGKHTVHQTVQFTMDNTPPLIVLQRPSTKADAAQPDSYGQKFTLEGQAADDSGVSLIELEVYGDKECKNLLYTVPLKNVPNTINLDVAEFRENEDGVYAKIYGSSTKKGTERLFCKVAAYDGAMCYPANGPQTEADKKGNKTDVYYLYEDIATTVLSSAKITEAYHILSGVYNLDADASRAANASFIENSVKENLKNNATNVGSFTLNPENNPMFTVSGRDAFTKDSNGEVDFSSEKYDISNGSSVIVEITPGLDNIPLKKDETLKTYFIECDSKGNAIPGAKKIYPTPENAKPSGSAYKITVPVKGSEDGIILGRTYLFGVEGTDEKGNPILSINNASYGFRCLGKPAELEITEPKENAVILGKDKKLTLKGFANVETGLLSPPSVKIYKNNVEIKTIALKREQAVENAEKTKLTYNFECEIEFSELSGNYEIKTIANSGGIDVAKTKTVFYDCNEPTGELKAPTAKETQIQSHTFNGKANDEHSGVQKVELTLRDKKDKEKSKTVTAVGTAIWNYPLEYKSDEWKEIFGENQGAKLASIKVTDNAGNVFESNEIEFIYDTEDPKAEIDKKTIQEFMSEKGFDISVTASDSYKLKKVTVAQNYKASAESAEETFTKEYTDFSSDPTKFKSELQIPFDKNGNKVAPNNGAYTYYAIAEDEAGNKKETDKFSVKYDNEKPTVAITNPQNKTGKNAVNSTNDKFEGTFTEENLFGIYYKIQAKDSPQPAAPTRNDQKGWTKIESVSGSSWSFYQSFHSGKTALENSFAEGSYALYVRAIDKADNVSDNVFVEFDVDMQPPAITKEISAAKNTDPTKSLVYFKGDLTLKVTTTDSNGMALQNPVDVKVGEKTVPPTDAAEIWEIKSGNFAEFGITDGKNAEITITATDVVGKTTTEKFFVCLDQTAPSIDVVSPANGENVSTPKKRLKGTISDVASGVKTATYSLKRKYNNYPNGHSAEEEVRSGTIMLAGESFNVEEDEFLLYKDSENAKEGTFFLYIEAKDNLENMVTTEKIEFFYDKGAPELKVNPIDSATNKNFTVSGKVWDTNEIKSLTIYVDDAEIEKLKDIAAEKRRTTEPDSENFSVKFVPTQNSQKTGSANAAEIGESVIQSRSGENQTSDILQFADISLKDGEHKIKIVAEDIAGNKKEEIKTIIVDTEAPNIEFGQLPTHAHTENSGNKWYNKTSLALTGAITNADQDGKKVSGIESAQYTVSKTVELPDGDDVVWHDLNIKTDDGGNITWKGSIDGLTEGANTVHLKIKDYAGNENKSRTQTFYVDSLAPDFCKVKSVYYDETATKNSPTEQNNDQNIAPFADTANSQEKFFTNGTKPIVVKVSAKDYGESGENAAPDTFTGLADNAVEITRIGSAKVAIKSTKESGNGEFTITIPPYSEANKYTSGAVKAVVTDRAGNKSQEFDLFQMELDNHYPKVTINKPADADTSAQGIQINKTIELTGSVTDDYGFEGDKADVTLEYSTDGGTNWNRVSKIDTNAQVTVEEGGMTWKANLDTEKFTDKSKIKLRAVATDKADNTGNSGGVNTDGAFAFADEKTVELEINQDSDRPKISFNNISLGGAMSSSVNNRVWLKNTTKLYGTVQDDDGIKSVQIGKKKENSDEIEWKDITVDGMAWTFDTKDFFGDNADNAEKANGEQTFYFKITDKGGGEFTSKTASDLNSVYLVGAVTEDGQKKTTLYGSSEHPDSSLYLRIDTLPPEIILNGARIGKDGDFNTNYSGMTLGGKQKTIQFKITATDGNGIEKVTGTAKFGDKSGDNSIDVIGTKEDSYYVLTFNAPAEVTDKDKEGSIVFKFTAHDNSGNSSSQTATVNFDYKKPDVNIMSPTEKNYVSGIVTAYGTIDSDCEMYYALSTSNKKSPAPFGTAAAQENANIARQDSRTADGDHTVTTWSGFDPVTLEPASGSISIIPKYEKINGSGLNWFVHFDGEKNAANVTHDMTFQDYLVKYGIITDDNKNDFKTIVRLYLWIKAVDKAGNEAEKFFPILLDPQGDAPSVAISYPIPPKEDNSTETFGGPVTIIGTASDTGGTKIGVKNVWVQIDSNADGVINQTDVASWFKNGEKGHTYDVYKITDPENKIESAPNNLSNKEYENYYIKASLVEKGSSWSLKINNNKEFDPPANENKMIKIKVIAQDLDGKISKVQECSIKFNADAPVFSDLYLRQYANNDGTGDITASRPYEEGMWIKGNWWLCGTVTDDIIKQFKITGVDSPFEKNNGTEPEENFKYLISTSGVGKKEVTIFAADNSGHPTTKELVINFDNKEPESVAPQIPANIQNSNGFFTFSSTVKEDLVGKDAQSGFKYLAFYFTREIGGTKKVYDIMRKKGNGNEITYTEITSDDKENTNDSVWKKTEKAEDNDDGLIWKTKTVTRDAANLNILTLEAGGDKNIHAGGLCKIGGAIYMIKDVNGTKIALDGFPELPKDANEKYITESTAYFAIANVVNNTIESAVGADKFDGEANFGYPKKISNDDGDNMVESVLKQSSTWTWEANINSRNIPDGDITLHYVAFDNAGNYTANTVENLKVANNAPRLASLTVWTDYNNDGNMQDNECATKYYKGKTIIIKKDNSKQTFEKSQEVTDYLVVSGNDKDIIGGGTPFMTIKAETKLYPELVGGNGELYYTYSIKDKDNGNLTTKINGNDFEKSTTKFADGKDDGSDQNAAYFNTDSEGTRYVIGTINGSDTDKKPITISEEEILSKLSNNTSYVENNIERYYPTWFEYTIYDSTEGCKDWGAADYKIGRLSATFRVALNIQYNDEERPKVVISPFYWNASGDKNNSVVWNDGKPQGHIELENDLENSEIKTDKNLDEKLKDADPKVSGRIKIEGYAFDNIKLASLTATFDDLIPTSSAEITYNNSNWSENTNADKKWNFTAQDVFINSEGHLVHWTLEVDTAQITHAAGLDKKVTLTAKDDRGKNTEKSGGLLSTDSDGGKPAPNISWASVKNDSLASKIFKKQDNQTTVSFTEKSDYKMDVVPYITGVETSLSGLDASSPSVYNRTALGKYPINWKEAITIYGFNLKDGTLSGEKGATILPDVATETTANDSAYYGEKYTLAKEAVQAFTSGQVKITVNGIPTLNNLNNNDAKGDYTETVTDKKYDVYANYYNCLPNDTNNALLTDDIDFDIWEFKSDAVVPISGKIEQPVMKIRPTDGKIGFAFANGPLYFSMGGGGGKVGTNADNDYSYQYWSASFDFFTSIGFAYDDNGNSWGVAAGGDINSDQADKFNLMSSKWGLGLELVEKRQDSSYNANHALRLESIGQKKNGVKDFDKQRIKSPSLATSVSSTTTNVYLAYYDALNDEIRFKSGTHESKDSYTYDSVVPIEFVDRNDNYYNYAHIQLPENAGDYFKNDSTIYFLNEDGKICDKNGTPNPNNEGYKISFVGHSNTNWWFKIGKTEKVETDAFPLWGGYTENNIKTTRTPIKDMFIKIKRTSNFGTFVDYDISRNVYPYRKETVSIIAGEKTSFGAGEYVSIAVIPAKTPNNPNANANGDIVVAVWYDEKERTLYYSYNKSPLQNRGGNTDREGWSDPKKVFENLKDHEMAGEYCKIAVDANGGIHIAAYDPVNLDLCYAYVSPYTENFKPCVVDSAGVVGSNLTLDVALVDKKPQPYIGYYATSCIKPKYATLKTPGEFKNGSINDKVTGNWEISVVPTTSVIEMQSAQHNDINIGVWKNNEGELKDSKFNNGTSTTSYTNSPNGYASQSNGNVYGNGTNNAVLGYVIKNNSQASTPINESSARNTIETAQKK